MSTPISLLLSNKRYSYEVIRQGNFPAALAEYERNTWQCCHDWLTGKETFTLRTSGSTGPPKSIALTRTQLETSARMTGKALDLQPGDSALVNLHTDYVAGLMMLVRGFVLDLHLTIVPPAALPFREMPADASFDFLSFVPLQLQATLEQMPERITTLNAAKAILVGGAPVNRPLLELLQQIHTPVYQTYGMTETISHIALRQLNGKCRSDYYTVLPGVHIRTDERDCLVIQTPTRPDETIVTNDVVKLNTPDSFAWLGRIDNVINSGGVKVQAEKVEQTVSKLVSRLGLSRRLLVAGLPHPQLGESVTLILEGEPIEALQEEQIRQQLSRTSLTRYEIPKSIRYVPFFAETSTGKLDRKRTIEQLLTNPPV